MSGGWGHWVNGEGPLVSCLSVVLVAGVVLGPAGSLCLSLPICFSGFLGLYLFFKTVTVYTSSSNWHSLLLVSRVGVEGIDSIRRRQWWGGMGSSGMGLLENLGSGIVQQGGGSLTCSSDWYGLHLGSRSQQKLGTGSQQWGRQWGGVGVSGMALWELNLGTGAVQQAGR